MTEEYQLRVLPEIAASEQRLKEYLSKEKGLTLQSITATRILKRSIDARQRTVFINLKVRVYINEIPTDNGYEETIYNNVEGKPQVIVVGAGPGGLFAALKLIELGFRPVIVERGKNVRERKKDLAQISREHTVDPESNYSFGPVVHVRGDVRPEPSRGRGRLATIRVDETDRVEDRDELRGTRRLGDRHDSPLRRRRMGR